MTNTGWICPRCGKVHAPWVASCDCVSIPYTPYIPYVPRTTPYPCTYPYDPVIMTASGICDT